MKITNKVSVVKIRTYRIVQSFGRKKKLDEIASRTTSKERRTGRRHDLKKTKIIDYVGGHRIPPKLLGLLSSKHI